MILIQHRTMQRSIQNEISSLRECIEICLEEIQQRHEADTKLSGMCLHNDNVSPSSHSCSDLSHV